MEIPLRAGLIGWLAGDPALAPALNAVTEETPGRISLPWLGITASSSTDWSTKTETGYEIRIAVELHCRGDTPDSAAALVAAIQGRIQTLPRAQAGFVVVGVRFLRARAQQTAENTRAVLLEYRFRTLDA